MFWRRRLKDSRDRWERLAIDATNRNANLREKLIQAEGKRREAEEDVAHLREEREADKLATRTAFGA